MTAAACLKIARLLSNRTIHLDRLALDYLASRAVDTAPCGIDRTFWQFADGSALITGPSCERVVGSV